MLITKTQLAKALPFDIETVSKTKSYLELSSVQQKFWEKKCNTDKNYKEELEMFNGDNHDYYEWKYKETAALYPEFNKIICISVGFFENINEENKTADFKLYSFYGDDEKALLTKFITFAEKAEKAYHILTGHNIINFDIPNITKKCIQYDITLLSCFSTYGKKPWERVCHDTQTLWSGEVFAQGYTGFELLCDILGIETSKDDIEGKETTRVYWLENGLERISKYCDKDTIKTGEVMGNFWKRGFKISNVVRQEVKC